MLMFDGLIGHTLWRQFESRNYPSTFGRITYSKVTREAEIRYHYEVNGQSFDGARLQYSARSASQDWARRVVDDHPVGSKAQVYFNAKDPADSLLFPGWNGVDIFSLLFLTPFNMVALGLWASVAGLLRERIFRPVAGGVKIIADGVQTRIRVPQWGAFLSGAIGAGGTAFISIFIVGFSTGFDPSFGLAATFLFLAVAGGIGAFVWQWRKIHSGDDDLIVNEASGVVELPETCGRKQRITVNVCDIAGITVEKIEHRSSKGGISYTYVPTLQLRKARRQKLADWGDKMKAEAFSEWLRKKLGLNTPDVEDPRLS